MIPFNPPADAFVPINPLLQCGEQWIHDHDQYDEEDDDDGFHGPITFHVQLPGDDDNVMRRLNFNCRDKSSGVLLPSEPSVTKEDTHDGLPSDPFFFEKGFYLEAKTGFQVWPGSRLMVEVFTTCNSSSSSSSLMEELSQNIIGRRLNILEVGAGIGVVGSCLAAAGGNVLITDLPVLVEHGIGPNLRRNGRANGSVEDDVDEEEECIRQQPCPKFLLDTSSCASSSETTTTTTTTDTTASSSLFDAVQIGKGWAKAAVLDWFKPVEEQLNLSTTSDIDVIVACDCIFLRKLANPLLTTIAAIFEHSRCSNNSNPKKFFFTFQRRNMMGLFIQLEELLDMIEERGWTVECVAWRDVHVEDDGVHQNYLFQVTPSSANTTDSLDDNVCSSNNRGTMNVSLVEEEKKE